MINTDTRDWRLKYEKNKGSRKKGDECRLQGLETKVMNAGNKKRIFSMISQVPAELVLV